MEPMVVVPHTASRGPAGTRSRWSLRGVAHAVNPIVRLLAQLHQQAGRDGPRRVPDRPRQWSSTSKPSRIRFRMDSPVTFQASSKSRSGASPSGIGACHHSMCRSRTAVGRSDQAGHRSRSPVLNRVEVGVEIPPPGPRILRSDRSCRGGAPREADPAPAIA